MITKICLICGKEFKVFPCRQNSAKYCSCKCRYESKRGKKRPEHSEKMKGSNNPRYKGRLNHSGYILIFQPNHPFRKMGRYIFEHRLIVEKHLNRYLKPTEAIHHINGIKTDNRIENLYLFSTRYSHSIYHFLSKSNPELIKEITKSNLLTD